MQVHKKSAFDVIHQLAHVSGADQARLRFSVTILNHVIVAHPDIVQAKIVLSA